MPTVLVSAPLVSIGPSLLEALRSQRQTNGLHDPIERAFDAFMLDPGLGPPVYLTSDGRFVWWDDDGGWGCRGTRADAFAAIRVGARKTGVIELLTLMPPRPNDASRCESCAGDGWEVIKGLVMPFLCGVCAGVGWTDTTGWLQEIVSVRQLVPNES